MKDIRIGVIGIGHLGNYHLQKYRNLEGCVITAVADVIEDKAFRAAEQYDCRPYSDHRDLLGTVDAVSIAVPTPVNEHLFDTIKKIEALNRNP